MIRRTALVAVLAAALAAGAVAGEIVEIPLALPEVPLFLGEAGQEAVVLLPFDAGRPLTDISQLGLRLVGAGDFARNFCWNFGDFGGGVWTHPDVVGLTGGLRDGAVTRSGTTLSFDPADYPQDIGINLDTVLILADDDWTCLADGTGTIELRGLDCTYDPSHPEVCICDASLVLLSVTLVVARDGALPAAPAAWGAVKARYRS